MKKTSWLFILCLFLLISTRTLFASDVLVPTEHPTIQGAINAAQEGDVVKVAVGTYPENIVMKEGVLLQGGYSLDFSARDISLYVTVIDGGQNGSAVLFEYISSASIDGFTITNGYFPIGGGIRCYYSHPTITNNTITDNEATMYGGGIYCNMSNPHISGNTISGNRATVDGGGIECIQSSPVISNNVITENYANNAGGGIDCYSNSNPTISNNTITNNDARYGGGILCDQSDPKISNSIISGNHAVFFGGAIYSWSSAPEISNCTIVRNSATGHGTLFFSRYSSPQIFNTIFWQNDDDLIFEISSPPTVSYSNISDPRFSGQNENISSAPLFMDLQAGDYRLNPDSPCVDSGNPSSLYNDPDGSRNDMGAFGGPGAAAWGEEIPMIPVPYKEDPAWEDLGLYGGQIKSLAIDPLDSNKMFAASYEGDGLFVTTDGGRNWQTVEGFRNKECLQVAIDARDHNRVWVAYSYFIARSDDGGASWSKWRLTDDRFAYAIVIDPTDSNTLYVGAGGQGSSLLNGTIFKTIDGGSTWQQTNLVADRSVTFLAINPLNPDELWALTGYNEAGSVYKSSDAGNNWVKIDIGYTDVDVNTIVIHPDNPSTVYISGTFGVVKTADSGIRWESIGIPEPCGALTLDPQDPKIVYAATKYMGTGNYLYRSPDRGKNWETYPIGYNAFSVLMVNPQDSNILYGGDSNLGVFESLDGGGTWRSINEGIKANIVYDSAIDPNNPDILLAGTIAGLFKRDPDGVWTQLAHQSVFSIAYDPTNTNISYMGQDYTLVKTTDYGNTWEEIDVSPSVFAHRVASITVDPQNSNILYLGVLYYQMDQGEIYKSIDGGKTLSLKKVFDVPVNVVKIDPTDSQVLYAGTGSFYESSNPKKEGGIYKSVDRGENWVGPLLTGVVVNSIEIDPSDPNVLYAGCGSGGGKYRGFYKSVDGGLSWEKKEFVWSAVTEIKINPERTSTLYAATDDLGVYMSVDAGENWVNIGLSDYEMRDLSISEATLAAPAKSSLRGSCTQESSARLNAGTNSGMAGYKGISIKGYIYDSTGSSTVYPASVWLDVIIGERSASVFDTGAYLILHPPAGKNYTLYCRAEGYREVQIPGISVETLSAVNCDFYLLSLADLDKADIDGDEDVDLADAILAMKVVAGTDTSGLVRSHYAESGADVDGDNKVGMDELIYIMQVVAGLR